MPPKEPRNPWVYPRPMSASRVLPAAGAVVYYPMDRNLVPFVRGLIGVLQRREHWSGTEEEIDAVLNALVDLRAADTLDELEIAEGVEDVEIQVSPAGTRLEYRVQIAGQWTSWRDGGELPSGPVGPAGEAGPTGPTGANGQEVELSATHPLDGGGLPVPNIVDVFWRYVGAAQWSLLERLTAPSVQGDQLLTYVQPRWLVAGNLAQPEGRFMVWDASAEQWVPSGNWFEIGDLLTAPAGPQGEQGEPGPVGPVGPTGSQGLQGEPGSGYVTTSGQYAYRDWMWIAEWIVRANAEQWIAWYENPLTDFLVESYRLGLSRIATIIPSMENWLAVLGAASPAYGPEIFEDEEVIEAAAQLLYCQLVNHQTMTNFDLATILAALGEPGEHSVNVADADKLLACTTPWLFSLQTNGADWFRASLRELQVIALSQAQKPDWQLACTPVIEDWQSIDDFVPAPPREIWLVQLGVWIEEWQGVLDIANNGLNVKLPMGGAYGITTIEIVYSFYGCLDPAMILFAGGLDEYYPLQNGEFEVFRLNDLDLVTDFLEIQLFTGGGSGAHAVLHRVSLAGVGTPPPWATG